MSDIPLWEINEAFAAQVLACQKAFASDRFAAQHLDRPTALGAIADDKLNVNGGAIALGHPVGATGARIVLTLLMEMKRRNVNLGVARSVLAAVRGRPFCWNGDRPWMLPFEPRLILPAWWS